MTLAIYIYMAMATWVAPAPKDVPRYESMASDFAVVATEAPVMPGKDGAARTALLMASIGSFESFFRADVDDFTKLGDGGHSKGILQVWLRRGEACTTRVECLRIGRERIRESLTACHGRPVADLLAEYASGRCDAGLKESRHRMNRATSYWKASPFQPLVPAT